MISSASTTINLMKKNLLKKQLSFLIKFSLKNVKFLTFLRNQGFINGFEFINKNGKKKVIKVFLKYDQNFQTSLKSYSMIMKRGQNFSMKKNKFTSPQLGCFLFCNSSENFSKNFGQFLFSLR